MTEEEKTATLPSDVTDFLGMGQTRTGGYDTLVRQPSFAGGTDEFNDQTRKERKARFKASADMLFSTDVSKLDDAGASALYQSVTEGMFGLPDEDGSVAFGKRASKDPRANIEMLRKFVKGDYTLIEDPEYTKWRQMDDEAKFKYAMENETTGNKFRSYMKGERGAGFWENLRGGAGMSIVGLPAGAVAFQPDYIRDQNEKIAMESARRSNYETLTDEEKEKYRADVVADYDEKLSRRQTLATFLQFAHGLSDRAGYLLAKSFNDGTPDAANIEGLPEDERDRVYAAFSLMRGDQKKGQIFWIDTDFTDDTAANRLQLGLYGFQQSVVGLVTDTGGMARDAAMWAYAKCAMDEAERKEFFKGWDANVRAEQAMRQELPEASGIVGEAFQGLSENLHWFIPYSMIGKGGKLAKGARAAVTTAKLQQEVAEGGLTLAKAAAEASRARWLADVEGAVKAGKGAKKISEFSSAIAMRRQLAAVEQYTAALREIPNVVKAAKWKDAAGAGMWAAGEASAFSAFASEYVANADAAGISREESVLTAAAIGLINAKIEQLYVPGLESSLTPAQIKSLTFAAMAQAIKTDGAAGFRKWLANRVSKGVTEGVKVTLTEGAVEEPLQQMAIEHGKAFDKLCGELRENGQATLANEAKALWDSFARTLPNDYATFIDTAADMVPSSLGFGVTTIGNMTRRQHIHNAMTRHANRRAGLTSTMMTAQTMQELQGATDYDAGLVDVIQQAVNVRAAVEKHWQGEEDGGEAKNPHRFEEAITAARRAWRDPQTGDAVQEIADAAGVDVKTAEVLAQYLQTEAEAMAFSPQARAWTALNMSLADIDEATIKTVLPGYVEGSFASDPENGIYSGRVRMDDGTEKTIAYRVGDLSAELVAEAQNMAKADSSFGKSFDARHAELGDGVTWASLSDAQRYAEAVRSQASVNGFSTGKSGVFELTDSKGEKVRVNADDIIYLANGRIGDIGYGPAATQGTVRHETFHSLWRFVRGTLADADVQQLAKTLGIDVTKDGWEVELDEKMAHEMERYASGHYVSHAVSSRFDKMLDSWAGKIINFFGQFGPSDEVTDPKTGKPYQLKGLYDSILRGELGSGALGVELRKVPQQTAERTATPASSMPVEVTDADRAEAVAVEREEAAKEEPPAPAAPTSPAPAVTTSTVPVATSESPADAATPNQVYYRVGLPNSNVKLVGRLEVRDVETGVITSTDADYHDRGNQNRDDKSEESRALVEKIGAYPDPLQLGTVQPIASNGIIWILPNGDDIIGNHRANGVRRAYEKGTAADLEKFVREDAAKRGIEIGAAVKKPLMVFVLERIESPDGKADVHEVVRLANESQNRGFNIREQAGNDAKILVDNNLLPRMAFRADGRIDETKSGDAIGKFRQESGAQGLIAEDGSLTEEGQTRIQNAALAVLLGGEGNNALLNKIMTNAGRLEMQNELRALMKMTPELMALAEAKPAYDLRAPLAEALQLFTEWRDKDETARVEKGKTRHDWRETAKDGHRVRGLSWEAFMSQGDMFRQPSDEAKILGDMFAKAEQLRSFDREDVESAAGKKRVIDLISDYLADYIANARAVNTETDDLFGGSPATRAEIMAAQRATGGEGGGETSARFSIAGKVAASNMGIKGAADAEAMEKAGADREDIWRKTGWWRGKDGRWRFELPSVKMKGEKEVEAALREGITSLRDGSSETTLEKVLDAPALFEAYPRLKKTKIVFSPEHDDKTGGWYDAGKNEIVLLDTGIKDLRHRPKHEQDLYDTYQQVINSDEFLQKRFSNMDAFGIKHGTAEEERALAKDWIAKFDKSLQDENAAMVRDLVKDRGQYSTFGKIVHEIQHAVQYLETFAKGGNPESADAFVKNMKRKQRIWAYKLEVEDMAKQLGTSDPYKIERAILSMLGVTSREQIAGLEAEGWIPDQEGRDKGYNLYARGYDKEGYEDAYNEYLGEIRKNDRAGWWEGTPHEIYRRLAGEVEARNASRREAMTPEERAVTPPWETEDVPGDRQIIRYSVTAQTETPQFKNFFGDWEKDPENASKVVDKDGKPLIVYRRDNEAFTVFDFTKTQQNDAGWLGKGFYFYGDKGEAESATGYGKNLRAFYLNIRNPYHITSEEYNRLVEADDPKVSREFTERLKAEGYDGVYWNGDLRQEWAAFEPTQIKSATDNTGAFNPRNPDIRYSVTAQRVTPEEDAAYADAVKRGDMKTVRRMEREVYERMGYSDDSSYQGTSAFNGAAPSRNAYFETKAERIEAAKNGEMEDSTTLGDYRDGIDVNNLQFIVFDPRSERNADPMRQEAIRNIRGVLDSGAKTITMYRSVPADVKEGQFRNGDWITPSRAYAEENAQIHGWGDKFRIIEQEVSVEDVWWDGNDIAEWGFDDGRGSVYKNTAANRKLLGPTYDDAGNLIPLSKRFNDWKNDVRYSVAARPAGRNKSANVSYPDAGEEISSTRFSVGAKDGIRYSIARTPTGEKFVLLDRPNRIDWNDRDKVREYLATLVGSGAVSLADERRIEIGKELPDEYTRSSYAEKAFRNVRLRKVRGKTAQHLDELIAVSGERAAEPAKHKKREGGVYYRRAVNFAVFGHEIRRGYSGDLVSYEENGQEYLYDLVNIQDNPSLVPDSATGGNGGFEILSTYNGEGSTPRSIPQSGAPAQGGRFSVSAPAVADPDVQVAKESAEQRYSVFAGEKTATPRLLKPLAEAKAMLGDGQYTDAVRREIYDKTGWWRGTDGKWRVELPNLKAKYFDADESVEFADADVILEKYGWNEYSAYWLRDLVTFPKGLKANTYELGETLIFFVDEEQMKSASGGEDASAATFVRVEQGLFGPQVVCEIHVVDPMADERELKGRQRLAQSTLDSLTHELQHVIQLREGFAFGGNTSDAGGDRAYGAAAGEVEARNAARRNDPENRTRPPWATEDVPARYQSVGYSGWEWTDADGWRPMTETAALSPAAVRPAAEGRRHSVSAPLVAAMQERERRANALRAPQGDGKSPDAMFSTEAPRSGLVYPQLRSMSDDELLSAAVAVRMALGTSDKPSDKTIKINTVQKIMRRLHPDWDGPKIGFESMRILLDARKFGKRIREDLDRGVSDSLILEHLPQAAREQFGFEMRQEARKGQSLGVFGQKVASAIEERQAKIVEDAVRVQTGLDANAIESAFGINLSETIMHLAENPLKEKPTGGAGASESGTATDEDGSADDEESAGEVEIDAKVKAVMDDIVSASRDEAGRDVRNREDRRAAAGRDAERSGDEGSASGDSSAGEGDALAAAVKKASLDLENPRHLARLVAELARRKWIQDHGLAQNAEVWRDLVAVQFLRKTAQSVYAKLVRDLTYSRSRETAMGRIAKLDNVPTIAGLLSEMEFLGALVNAQRIRDKQKSMCEKLDQFLREKFGAQGRFKPDKEEGKRSVSAEAELRARYMRHAMWLTPDAAADEARQLQETLDALSVDFKDAGRDRDQSREFVETIRKLNVLREFGALRYKPVGEIEAAAQWWEYFARGESNSIVREMSDRDIRTKKAAHLLAVAFADPKRTTIREGGKVDALNRFITGHMGFVSLLQDCMRYASDADAAAVKDIVDYITREVQKSGDRSEAEKRRHNDAFHSAVESIYGKGFNAVMKDMMAPDERFTKYMGVVGGKRVTPTKGRALQLLVSLLQEGRKVQVEDEDNPGQTKTVWMGGYHDNIVKNHREGQADEIMKLLTPADMNMLKWLGQWYENNRSDLSQVCHSLFGIGVYAELPNYFPVKMQLATQGLEKGQGVGWTIFPKALTPRVRNERDFDTSADIFSMWASRMEEAAQWKHHAQLGLELRGIFGRAELREAVRANHGASVDELMQGFITDILAGHGAYDRSTAGVQYFSDQIRGWTALCALGGNIGVMAKQTTSIPAFGFEIGLVNTAKYMVSAFTPEGMSAMAKIWDSEQRRTRWNLGSSEAVRNALNQQNAGWLKRMLQKSMVTNKLGDVVPALVVGQGIYRDCLDRGMSEEDAMAETWSIIERTQQSGRMENQTSIQRRNKLGRIMFQFLSTQQQYLQYEVRAIREVIARPDSVKRWGSLGRAVVLAHFVLPTFYYWMGELYKSVFLGQEPPEDELKDWVVSCLLGPYGSLFVAGFCCKYTLERAIKGYSIRGGSSMLPMESWLKNQVNDGAKLLEAIFDSDGDTWDNMLDAIGRWMSDSNSIVRDLRKIYRYRVKGEPQKRK